MYAFTAQIHTDSRTQPLPVTRRTSVKSGILPAQFYWSLIPELEWALEARRRHAARVTLAEPRQVPGAMRPGRTVSSENDPQASPSAAALFRHCRATKPDCTDDPRQALGKPKPQPPP
jgi:hypothetical protein